MTGPICPHCQTPMVKAKKSENSCLLQILGVAVFFFGLALCFTGYGIFIGAPIIIVAALMGHRKVRVVKCPGCGYFYRV